MKSLYTKINHYNQNFNMKNETIEKIKEELKQLDILNAPPIESINAYDI